MDETIILRRTMVDNFRVSTIVSDDCHFETQIFNDEGGMAEGKVPEQLRKALHACKPDNPIDEIWIAEYEGEGLRSLSFKDAFAIHDAMVDRVKNFTKIYQKVVTYVLK